MINFTVYSADCVGNSGNCLYPNKNVVTDKESFIAATKMDHKKNISISELARRIGQTPQNFGKKLKRDTVTLEELKLIADVMGVTFEQSFIFPDGEQIKTSNE